MQIESIQIKNFRSLRNVQLFGLENLTVLIGKNSSGKSNLLEALGIFFDDFAVIGGNTAGLDEYYWFNKKTENPIEFELSIKLTNEELEKIFKPEHREFLEETKFWGVLHIKRKIINKQGAWETTLLECSGASIVKDNKPVNPADIFKKVLSPRTEEATASSAKFAESSVLSTNELNAIINQISSIVGKKFELISQIRDVKNLIARRVTLVDSTFQSALWTLDQSIKSDEEEKFQSIEESFSNIAQKQLDPAQGQVYIRRQQRRFPLYLEGGGIQASLQMVFTLKNEMNMYSIFGIEEPEAHLHSELQRKLFDELKSLSGDCQLLITTHSPTFVDRADLNTVWVSRFVDGETTFERTKELVEIVKELGIKPSDVLFFANQILFVEGKSDQIVIPAFAKRLKIDLTDVAIVSVEGKSKTERNLKTWVRTTHGVLPIFLLLDRDAETEIVELEKQNLIERGRYHVWRRGSIECYYPLSLLKKALNELNERYSLEMDVSQILNKVKSQELPPDKIDLGEKRGNLDRSWKVLLAESIANLLRKEKDVDIDDEVRTALSNATTT